MRQVLPLAPEPIANTDGNTKQDCEINAGKRIVGNIRQVHPNLKSSLPLMASTRISPLSIY
jgi:hypothetical protein